MVTSPHCDIDTKARLDHSVWVNHGPIHTPRSGPWVNIWMYLIRYRQDANGEMPIP